MKYQFCEWSLGSVITGDRQWDILKSLWRPDTLEMFVVSLVYDHICLRIDVFKINYCLDILFIIWFLYVFYSITFVLRKTDLMQRE